MRFRILSVVLAICTLTCSCSTRQPKASSAPANHDIAVYPHNAAAVKSSLYSISVNRAPVFVEKYKDINYLLDSLGEKVIAPAESKAQELEKR